MWLKITCIDTQKNVIHQRQLAQEGKGGFSPARRKDFLDLASENLLK